MKFFFDHLFAYFNLSVAGRASKKEFICFTIIDIAAIIASVIAAASCPPYFLLSLVLVWHLNAVTCRRRHDFYRQHPTSPVSTGNILEDVQAFADQFTLGSDDGDNEYGPEPKKFR